MHRFFLSPEQCQGDLLTLEGREAHHAHDVLRIRPHEKLLILNGVGGQFLCEVLSVNHQELRLAVLESQAFQQPLCRITLAQALPKGKLFEAIIQKATELGVSQIVPVLSERVVTHINQKEREQKREKWQAVAIESIKQCGSPWLPVVNSPLTPQQLVERANQFECAVVGSLQANARHPREYFQQCLQRHGSIPRTVCIWIGPEGDFTESELGLIEKSGACPITLGPLILRTETAAIYCLSVLNYEFAFASRL